MKSAYAYMRVSTREQGRSGLGLEAQREAIERLAERDGYTVLDWVTDIQTGTGADGLQRRPKLATVIQKARKAKVPVLVSKLDRFCRNVALGAHLLEVVRVVAAECPSASKFEQHLRMTIAEEEVRKIRERISDALQAKKRRGMKLGQPKYLKDAHKLGAASTKREADTFARRMLPMINGYIASGCTMVQTAEKLNEMRVPTMRGAQWYDSTIVRLLQRARQTA